MKSIVKNTAFVMASIALLAGSAVMMQKSKAAANIFSGKCGGVFKLRTAADGVINDGDTGSVSASVILDFDANKVNVASTRQTSVVGGNDTWAQQMDLDKTMIVEADTDGMIGAYQVSFTLSNGASPVLRIIPVNSNNTFLIQGKNVGATGVCQKI
jgi:hypothetical protein